MDPYPHHIRSDGAARFSLRLSFAIVPLCVQHSISHIRDRCVVRNDRCSSLEFSVHALNRLEDQLADRVIEGTCGFVTEQDIGTHCDCSRNRNTLLFTTGKLRGKAVHSIGETTQTSFATDVPSQMASN